MNLEVLRTFLAVAEHGSITSAARALGYSQPTVSQHVMRLEGWLHRSLFTRGARLELTEAGAMVAPLARVVLLACAEMNDPAEAVPPPARSTVTSADPSRPDRHWGS